MADKVSFIKQVTKALGRTKITRPNDNYDKAIFEDRNFARANAAQAVADANSMAANLIDQMVQSADDAGWKVQRADNYE